MQKSANRVLSALLVLVMVLSMLPATVFATGERDVLEGWNITLGDDIGVKFHLSSADYTVTTTVNGTAVTPTISDKVVTVNVAAAQMNDPIVLTVKNGEETVHTGEYSVKEYANTILAGDYDTEVKELVQQMLIYGAAAQTYFSYNADDLACDLVSDAAVPEQTGEVVIDDQLSGLDAYAATLVLKSKIAVRFYFVTNGNIGDYSFSTGNAPVEKDGKYYVEVGNINPQDLDKPIDMEVTKGEEKLTVSYSPMNYIVRKYNNTDTSAELKALVQAMYGYHLEAVEYKQYQAIVPISTMSLATQHGSNGLDLTDDGKVKNIYASADANTAPGGSWSYEYTPKEAAGLKLIRDGQIYDVGIPGSGTIVKFADALYCIKLEAWTIANSMLPLVENDILVIEGRYNLTSDSSVVVDFDKTYIYYNGSTVEFSTEMPILPTTIDAGVMSKHSTNGWASNGVYASMAENAAPYDGWSVEYTPVAAENLKLIRGGETYNIGIPGRGTLVKYKATDYFLKMEWNVGEYAPMQDGDVLIVEGGFVNEASKVTLNISKTYIYANGDNVEFSTEMPTLPTTIDAGMMRENEDGSPEEIYFSMDANAVPVDEDIVYPYSGTVQLVSGGATSSLDADIYKIGDEQYYLDLFGEELADQDYLIVEGKFSNADNGYILNITKTYVLNDGGELVYSETEPVMETEYAVTGLTNHANGWSADGIYISHNAHEATVGTDWSVRYRPISADVIKLVRDGETFNIGQPAGDTLVVYGNTNMYFETKAWTTQGGKLPFVDGDQIVIEGKFEHEASGNVLVVEKTVICVSGSSLVFNPIFADALSNHTNAPGGDGVYATMTAVGAPYNTDWSMEYTPVSADAYRVIRDGVETNIGVPGRGTLVRYSETDHYLKISGWCLDGFTAQTSDIFIIDGFWKQTSGSATVSIPKTYLYHNGNTWVFATSLPTVVNAGVLQTHEAGMSGNGIYFRTAAVDAPFNGDWSLEYKQTSVDNIKLIRDGVTTSIGIVDRPMFVRINETDHYLKLENWTIGSYAPITTDDILIVEGDFLYAAENVTLNITKSYVYHDGTKWVCSAEAPVQKNIVDVVGLGSHGNGWTSGGFYFTAAANDAPLNTDWSLRYKPVSADVIKLVAADGTTTNVGNTGAETIVKFSETDYYVEGWAVGSANMKAGTVLVIDGQFYNEANDVYIDVEKTTITFNEGGSTTVIGESSKCINAGAMSAYTSNWFGDGIYFVLDSNIAPADAGWNVRYKPKNVANIQLVRGGQTYNIANTGAETIVKIADGQYWLSLEAWWWSSYAPIQDEDMLIVSGEFANASNGFTLNIDKTYITFVSKDNDNVVFSTAADTEFGDVLLPNSGDTLTIGMWNGSYHVFEDKQLKELQAAGITKIMGIDTQWIGTTDVNAWLDRVYSYGIRVIFDLRSWDGVTVPDYANHPGVIGFLMYDEPCATDFDNLATLKTKFDAVMPADKLFYVNLFPSCAAGTSLVGTIDWALGRRDYDTYYVQKFLDKIGADVLSWDNYSLLSGNGIRTDYFYNFEVMASKTGVEKWYTMLSAGHSTTSTSYATPSEDELRWQMAVAMTYGISNIDHYIYVSHEDDYSCMVEYDTWEPTDLYYDILKVDNEYLAWDNIYMAYDWVGIGAYSANSNNAMLTKLSKALVLSDYGVSVSANQNMLVGVFDYNGDKAYMVTNAGSAGSTTVGDGKNFTMTDATVTLTLGAGSYKCVAIIDNGEISYVAVNADNTVSLNVEAYEGVFVIPVKN